MVLVWNDLAGGDAEYCAAIVALNSLLTIALYPPFSLFFIVTLPTQMLGASPAWQPFARKAPVTERDAVSATILCPAMSHAACAAMVLVRLEQRASYSGCDHGRHRRERRYLSRCAAGRGRADMAVTDARQGRRLVSRRDRASMSP